MTSAGDAHAQVADVLRDVLGEVRFAAATTSRDLVADGLIDSFALLELTAKLEVTFDIIVPPARIGGADYGSVAALAAMCGELGRK